MKPASPSRSILPAQTLHCIGRSSGVPRTSPRQTMKIATTVSIDMSIGKDAGELCEADCDNDAVLIDCSAECSCAE